MCVTSEVGSVQAFTGAVPSGVAALSWDVAVSVGRRCRQAGSAGGVNSQDRQQCRQPGSAGATTAPVLDHGYCSSHCSVSGKVGWKFALVV